ncbi:putative F-box domain, FBD domain, leucine-rich repeat domain superfamily [Helianthus annuus]|nr:putative F-box domain, FBD domain, leucine-rich repeat domain superfamily [Helianthus annuus]
MENQNPRRSQSLNSDIISTLPLNIIESILSLMPLRDALRTSVLSKKWRYTWRGMPKLVFTNNMVTVSSDHLCLQLKKYKLISAIFHVLLLHKGPEILKFHCSFVHLHMESEFAQIISYLARENTLKQLFIFSDDRSYKLPISFFSLQGLEFVHLYNCTFEPPLTFNGFSSLTSVRIWNVDVSAQMLKQFLSKCPLLEYLCLVGCQKVLDFVAGENKFTFGDLLQCVPLIQTLAISKYYMKYLCAGVMPHKLPTSLAHLKNLFLNVCLVEQNEISYSLCIIRSSPVLEKIHFLMYDNEKLPVHQTPSNFLDPEDYPDLMLDYLVTLEIENFSKLPLEMKFVKLIMAKSPLLKNVKIKLNDNVSVDEEMKMLKDMLRLPFLRASPCAELIIDRP